MAKQNTKGIQPEDEFEDTPTKRGRNHLLLIGIDEYQHHDPLFNAVKDIEDFLRVLCERYQVEEAEAKVLKNAEATRDNIIDAFEELVGQAKEDDNVIIYFSGHGIMNQAQRGFWIPVNANPSRTSQFLRNTTVEDYIADIPSKHTLLIVDSCFSGTMSRKTDAFTNRVEGMPSRWLLTSGRKEPVSDGKPGNNSPFARALLSYLKNNQTAKLPVSELVQHVKKTTPRNSKQIPYGGYMQDTGDQGGEMIFHLKSADPEKAAWELAEKTNSVDGYDDFLEEYPRSKYASAAEKHMKELEEQEFWERVKFQGLRSGYRSYLRTYPNGRFIPEARDAIARLKGQTINSPVKPEKAPRETKFNIPKLHFTPPEMVFVKGGTFEMGDKEWTNTQPIHTVSLQDFYIGKYPLKVADYKIYCELTKTKIPNPPSWGWQDEHPMVRVSLKDIRKYCNWLSKETGEKYHIPTEAEWEFAARGGNDSKGYRYAGSNRVDQIGWYRGNSNKRTHSLGQKFPNELGIYDMSGNVWEWCRDQWQKNYQNAISDGSAWESGGGTFRVIRGGSWNDDAVNLRATYRGSDNPGYGYNYLGFRLTRTP